MADSITPLDSDATSGRPVAPGPSKPPGKPRPTRARGRAKAGAATGGSGAADTPPAPVLPGAGGYRMGDIGKRLEEVLDTIAGAVTLLDPYDGAIIGKQSHEVAVAWDKLAKRNPNVKKFLEQMLSGGDWGGVVIATGGMILPIVLHHKPGLFGGLPFVSPPQEPENVSPIVPPAPQPEPPVPGVSGSGESPTGPAAVSLPIDGSSIPGADPQPPTPPRNNGSSGTPSGAAVGLPQN